MEITPSFADGRPFLSLLCLKRHSPIWSPRIKNLGLIGLPNKAAGGGPKALYNRRYEVAKPALITRWFKQFSSNSHPFYKLIKHSLFVCNIRNHWAFCLNFTVTADNFHTYPIFRYLHAATRLPAIY